MEVLGVAEHQPAQLAALFRDLATAAPAAMYRAGPTLVFAVLGQARANRADQPRGRKPPVREAAHALGASEAPWTYPPPAPCAGRPIRLCNLF